MRKILTLLLISLTTVGHSQVRLDALTLKPKETYKILGSDILVIDSLIMGDSSKIILDGLKEESFLHFKWISIGKGCSIIGKGKNGINGKNGLNGSRGNGPCTDGKSGQDGGAGTNGENGKKLSVYLSVIGKIGSWVFDLEGGSGGDGGRGGDGGNGGAGTKVCQGGDAGNGGNGGSGGNGGKGGGLIIFCKECRDDIRTLEGKIFFFKVLGGHGGAGGHLGDAGNAGIGSTKDGKNGKDGLDGTFGLSGNPGNFTFSRN